MSKTVVLKIRRQADKHSDPYWETFRLPFRENMNVIIALMDIQKNPCNAEGRKVSPPTWDAACLEEVCGSCTMYVNGHIRQACTALIEDVAERKGDEFEVVLEPMKKFPIIRDLQVDRGEMFEALKKIKGWIPVDGSYDLGMAEPQDDHIRQLRYALSRCMTCGCCLEACPQINERSKFVGPAAIGQTLLFDLHPVGKTLEGERLDYLTSEEGITGCGNAQNCVKVCPKSVPLTEAIAHLNRDTTIYKIKQWMGLV
jgi:succinate dehydrogenase / fumarate reductase iron-sulfur subunit